MPAQVWATTRVAPTGWAFAGLLLVLTVLYGLISPRVVQPYLGPLGPLPPLRVGMDPSFLPFEFYPGPDAPPIGYDVDLARLIAQRLGREAAIVPTAYDSLVDGLLTGKLDVVISAFPYDPRLTQDLSFTGAYFNAGPVFVVKTGQALPQPLGRLAVEFGSASDVAARRLRPQPAQLIRLDSAEAVVAALTSGQADVALLDMVTALQARPSVQPVGLPIEDEFYVVAVRKDQDGLFMGINITVEALRREGVLDQLAAKWMKAKD